MGAVCFDIFASAGFPATIASSLPAPRVNADPTGKAAANLKLSEARARSIKSYLVAKGVKPSVIMSNGMGDTQTVVQCDKALPKAQLKECHAPNRRVEIEIVAKSK